MKFLDMTCEDKLTLLAGKGMLSLQWYIDGSFAVHPDFRSHTGMVMTMGKGGIINNSRKQKLNTYSSTTAELIASHDSVKMILWKKLILEAQGYHINKNILFQDNKSTILLKQNGKKSSGKRTRHLNIRYFFLQIKLKIEILVLNIAPLVIC